MTSIFEILITYGGLALFWFFLHSLWKPQRVDIYRQKLFAIRDELFDLGVDEKVDFEHPAYTELRSLMNGMIRFAHRATLPSLIVAALVWSDSSDSPIAEWNKHVGTLPEDIQEKLRHLHHRMFESYLTHLFGGSLTLQILVISYLLTRAAKQLFMPIALEGRLKGAERLYITARRRVAKKANADVIERRAFQVQREREIESRNQHVYA